jgi:hypothetical protein
MARDSISLWSLHFQPSTIHLLPYYPVLNGLANESIAQKPRCGPTLRIEKQTSFWIVNAGFCCVCERNRLAVCLRESNAMTRDTERLCSRWWLWCPPTRAAKPATGGESSAAWQDFTPSWTNRLMDLKSVECEVSAYYWPSALGLRIYHWINCGSLGCVVAKTLRYKPEGRGFDTRWGNYYFFHLTSFFLPH